LNIMIHKGHPALILDSEDIMRMGRDMKYYSTVMHILDTCRYMGIKSLIIITSLPYRSLPYCLRKLMRLTKNKQKLKCWRIYFD